MKILPVQRVTILPENSDPNTLAADVRFWSSHGLRVRCIALLFVAAVTLCFYVAAQLTPSSQGYGTHRQLGYPACLMPLLTGHPCPTCGMTTAFAYAVRGQLISAFRAQPAGLALAIALFAGALCCARVLVTGQYDFVKPRIQAGWLAVWVVCVLLFGWVYKWMTFTA